MPARKIKFTVITSAIIGTCAIVGIVWSAVVSPAIDERIELKNNNINSKIDQVLEKVNTLDKKTDLNQSNNDVRFEKINGKLDLINYRLDNKNNNKLN